MNAATLLYTREGRLRAPWRLAVFALATAAALLLAQLVATPLVRSAGPGSEERLAAAVSLLAVAFLLGHAFVLRMVDRRGWDYVGLGRAAARPRRLLGGLAIGVLAIGVPTALLLAVGWMRLTPAEAGSSWHAAWRLTLFLAPAALWEELAFRGYFFAVVREAWGDVAALLATSVPFGLIHLANPGADLRSTALVVLAGVFLGAVLLTTGSLYAAWLAHFGWNWAMAVVFHAAVSGQPLPSPDYRTVDAGPDWATGGVWGPEGGLAAALGMLAGMAGLLLATGRLGAGRRPLAGRPLAGAASTATTDTFARQSGRGEPQQ